jgi:hypothetical protein
MDRGVHVGAAVGRRLADGTCSMVICLRPLPIRSVSSVICQPSRSAASALRPSERLAGSSSQAMSSVSSMAPAMSRPWRRSTVRSYLALCATLARAYRWQRSGCSASRTVAQDSWRHRRVRQPECRPPGPCAHASPSPTSVRLHGVGAGGFHIKGDAGGAQRSDQFVSQHQVVQINTVPARQAHRDSTAAPAPLGCASATAPSARRPFVLGAGMAPVGASA